MIRETLDQALDAELYRAARDAAAEGQARLVELDLVVGPGPEARIADAIADLGAESEPPPGWQLDVWIRIAVEAAEALAGEEFTDALISSGFDVPDELITATAKRVGRKLARALGGDR